MEIGGKRYGISKDAMISYLPDTVITLTEDEFIERVKAAVLMKSDGEDEIEPGVRYTDVIRPNLCTIGYGLASKWQAKKRRACFLRPEMANLIDLE